MYIILCFTYSASLPNFSKRENPQYKSLKLITSLPGTQQQTLKSNAGNDAENETLRQALKGKKQAGKSTIKKQYTHAT